MIRKDLHIGTVNITSLQLSHFCCTDGILPKCSTMMINNTHSTRLLYKTGSQRKQGKQGEQWPMLR